MKYMKALGATLVAVAALAMIGPSSASATVICSTTAPKCPEAQKWPSGTKLDFSLKSGTTLRFSMTGEEEFTPVTCTGSTLRVTLEKGGATETVSAPMNQLTWSGCSAPTVTTLLGSFEMHSLEGTSDGLITWSGFALTYNSIVIGSCVWGPATATTFGTLVEGRPATMEVNTVLAKLPGSTSACPFSTTLKGEYTLTEPSNTTLSVSTSSG